ncbi:hypothetical protein B0H13DRAFT_2266625 [Mycena leptocephala]|nr:hypothetical protein B0H13DRAFT_2266625 [Mycena leptocephala]
MSSSSPSSATSSRIPALAPSDIAHVISLIQAAYAPTAATDLPALQSLQSVLFAMQRTPAAWGLIVPLLAHEDTNVQFFGAHTAHYAKIGRGEMAVLPHEEQAALREGPIHSMLNPDRKIQQLSSPESSRADRDHPILTSSFNHSPRSRTEFGTGLIAMLRKLKHFRTTAPPGSHMSCLPFAENPYLSFHSVRGFSRRLPVWTLRRCTQKREGALENERLLNPIIYLAPKNTIPKASGARDSLRLYLKFIV